MDKPVDLLQHVARCEPIAARLRELRKGGSVVFEHVTEAAQPFLAAAVAREIDESLWIICENVRAQEILHSELLNWFPDALLFPEIELIGGRDSVPDPEIVADRLTVLQQLREKRRHIIVVSHDSLDDAVPSPDSLRQSTRRLARNMQLDLTELFESLDSSGYERVSQVSTRGQYAARGGIIDIFSHHHSLPVRVELFGDQIDSIREFDLDAQTSVQNVDACTILLTENQAPQCALRDYIQPHHRVIAVAAEFENANVRILAGAEGGDIAEDYSGAFYDHGFEFEAGDLVIAESKRQQFFAQLRQWREEHWRTVIFCNNEGETERLRELLPADELPALTLTLGSISRGFIFPAGKLAVLSDAELFGRYRTARALHLADRRARQQARRAQVDFSELTEGELVVHLEHGIARYLGIQKFAADEKEQEVLALEFANEAKLYVPLEQAYVVSRYVSVGKKAPSLSALGDAKWSRAKRNAEQAVFDYAAKLLAVQAERDTSKGFAFGADTKWQREFERSFLFKETPDQLTAISDTKIDMESDKPMDRLICGDVGFGKTEVAIRAAFKAVMSGKQVAVLVPTTVLAQQHYQTFRERMSDYPVAIEMLSRFRSQSEQKKVVRGLADGGVDIVIGTHRLISKDVRFKDLGLVVVDEEQRFGVLHKEKFKSLFKLVDVLTLSATPIPRTLYLSFMGVKDMSVIETPPPNRIPIETLICGYDERIIRDAIQRELQRQGQIYFLHNRVNTIERVAERIRNLCPDARVEVGHGQMHEDELELVMQRFVAGAIDVLVSTTIIESGLDIPNANTIIIDRADRFGLADLYQLRGRVGRAQHKAYAYLFLPRDLMTVGAARKRINAIKQYSTLGAGFKIAMRDLEIRGAGNILGTEQSGHIIAIGFDLYCQLLKQAVASLKGERVRPRIELPLRLDFVARSESDYSSDEVAPAFLPSNFISDPKLRIKAYRSIAEITTHEQLDKLRKEWRDRFGELPPAATNLLLLGELKLAAAAKRISQIEVREQKVMITRHNDYILIGGKFPRLTAAPAGEALRELLNLVKTL